MEAEVREVPTAEDLLSGVREGVEKIVREALEEAAQIHAEADEKLERYDAASSELARLKLELHALTHEADEIPDAYQIVPVGGLVGRYFVGVEEHAQATFLVTLGWQGPAPLLHPHGVRGDAQRVGGGGEAQYDDGRVWVAKAGDGAAPVSLVFVGGARRTPISYSLLWTTQSGSEAGGGSSSPPLGTVATPTKSYSAKPSGGFSSS